MRVGAGEVINVGPEQAVRLVPTTWVDETTYVCDDQRTVLHKRTPHTEVIPVALEVF